MLSFAENAWETFNRAIADYHKLDDTNARLQNPFPENSLEHILYAKNWIDTVQWHLEDIIRDEKIAPAEALLLKRQIDASNQKRTDLVETLDFLLYKKYQSITPAATARINTETPAWAVDRLSILALKIYHMAIEAGRATADEAHRRACQNKLDILLEQKQDLTVSVNQLLYDIENGLVKMKMYKQMKMYNDESLNPVLYQKRNDD